MGLRLCNCLSRLLLVMYVLDLLTLEVEVMRLQALIDQHRQEIPELCSGQSSLWAKSQDWRSLLPSSVNLHLVPPQ